MKILKVYPESLRDSEEAIIEAAKVMLSGGTIIFPTDTVYGLGCDATNISAINKVFKIKERNEKKPLAVIVRDIEMARKVACIDSKLEKSLGSIWPGAVTLILRRKDKLSNLLSAGKNTIGLRIPDYKLTHWLSENMGRPYVATSANISGEQATTKVSAVLDYFADKKYQPDLVLDAGDLKCVEPSTVLDLSGKEPKIVRIGPVNKNKLLQILSI
jgi:L-threonylcarbamoyladenylate synthase